MENKSQILCLKVKPMIRWLDRMIRVTFAGFFIGVLVWSLLPVAAKPVRPGPKGIDLYGDPLPPGAIARLGTVRLRIPYFNSALIFSNDGKFFITGGGDENDFIHALGWRNSREGKGSAIRFWDAETGKESRRFDSRTRLIRSLALTPDGKLLASCGDDKEVRLWKAANGEAVRGLPTEHQTALVCFSPDGKTLAATTIRNTVYLWEVESGRAIRTIPAINKIYNQIGRLCFSSDGKVLAGALTHNGGIVLWDVASGNVIRELRKGQGAFYSLAFSGDGNTLAAGGLAGGWK